MVAGKGTGMDNEGGTSANDSQDADTMTVSITTIPETSASSDEPASQVSTDDGNMTQSEGLLVSEVAVPTRQVSANNVKNMMQSEGSLVGVIAQPLIPVQPVVPVLMLEIPLNRSNDKIVMV